MNLTIYAPGLELTGATNTVFFVGANASLTVICRKASTGDSLANFVETTGNGAVFNLQVEELAGRVKNEFNGTCQVTVTKSLTGSIQATGTGIILARLPVQYDVSKLVGKVSDVVGNANTTIFSSAQTINVTSAFVGRLLVTTSSSTGTYSVVLPNYSTEFFPAGGYFYILQDGNDIIRFDPGPGSPIIIADKDSGNANKTATRGAMIRVTKAYDGVVSHWSISGQLTT
jgi:hypothetical protein